MDDFRRHLNEMFRRLEAEIEEATEGLVRLRIVIAGDVCGFCREPFKDIVIDSKMFGMLCQECHDRFCDCGVKEGGR